MNGKQKLLAASIAALFTLSSSVTLADTKAKADDQKMAEAKKDDKKDEKWDVLNPDIETTTIKIDTDETTWSTVDVSPDGKSIVFDMLGDIYIMPITGGDATAITNDLAWNNQPAFSPDGKSIAFISDRDGGENIWTIGVDGENLTQISKEKNNALHNPAWSPDGQFIAGRKAYMGRRSIAGGSIWMYHTSGGKGVEVRAKQHPKQPQKNIAEPSFSPDGKYVYYSMDTTPGSVWEYNKNSLGSIFSIKRIDLETGDDDTIVSGAGGAIQPTPSPDGKKLAYIRRVDMKSAIYVQDLKSGKQEKIYVGLDRDMQEGSGTHGNAPAIEWTPDQKHIVFWAKGKFHKVDVASKEVTNIPVRVKAEKTVTPALRFAVDVAPDTFKVKMARWQQLSPDGNTSVFQALGHIYVKNNLSGKISRLTDQNDHFEYYPSLSRDGKSVVYVSWNDEKLGAVRIANLSNGKSRTVTKEMGHYIEPSFSPDGKKVVYRKVTGGYLTSGDWSMEPGVYLADVASGEAKRITRSANNVHFGADSDRVFFTSSPSAVEGELKSVNMDGEDERTHFSGSHIFDFKVSPNGKWVAYTQRYRIYVSPFVSTGKTITVGDGTTNIPVAKVSEHSGDNVSWMADSSTVTWGFASKLYSRKLDDSFEYLTDADIPEDAIKEIDLSFDQKADKPSGLMAYTNARIVTMRDADNTQEIIENGTILVEDNRIIAVGKSDDVKVPNKAAIFNVRGKTVYPGLVNVHAHSAHSTFEMNPQQNWEQYSRLAFGVTTTHDPSNDTSSVFSGAELYKAGLALGPRTYSTGRIMYAGAWTKYNTKIGSVDDAKFHIQRLKDAGAISVKSYNHPRRDVRQQVIKAAQDLQMMVVPEGGSKFQHNINMVVDGHTGVEHSIPVAHSYSDVAQLWGQTEVGYTPTFMVAYAGLSGENYWYQHTNVWENELLMSFVPDYLVLPRAVRRTMAPEHHYNHIDVAENAKKLRDVGVRVLIGAHGQREGLAAHWEIWSMVQGGFTPWEALRGATIDGAKYVGLDKDLGSIEKGKLADFVIVDGDPIANIRTSEKVKYVVLNGRLYNAATMDEMGKGGKKRKPFFFENSQTGIHPDTAKYMEDMAKKYHWVH